MWSLTLKHHCCHTEKIFVNMHIQVSVKEREKLERKNNKTLRHTYLMLSVCVLYSMMVLGGRLRTLRRVSLMREVVDWSLAVLFQMEIMSSCEERSINRRDDCECDEIVQPVTTCYRCMHVCCLPGSVLTPQPRRSPLPPWTAPLAWPGSGSPSIETPGLSSDGWSTFHPSY